MIYVTDGVQTVKVTTGAYENYYRPQGFHPVGRGRPEPSVPTAADAVVEEDVDQRLMEKPINKWTKAELAGFAKRNGISLEGVSKVAEVRRLVAARIEAMQAPELIEDVLEG